MKSEHQKLVDCFMILAKQEVPVIPTIPSTEVRLLRAKLILEEALELITKGLGIYVRVNHQFGPHTELKYDFCDFYPIHFNWIETIDGCCDLKVVTTGTLSACGIPDEDFQEIVDKKNLEKFAPGYTIREDGKLIKPPDFVGPEKEIEAKLKALSQP